MPDFSGKRVLVTGSSRGIGRATAGAFLAAGARVAVNGRSPMRRMAEPREIAAAILYLDSDGTGFTTGAALSVGGGRTACP